MASIVFILVVASERGLADEWDVVPQKKCLPGTEPPVCAGWKRPAALPQIGDAHHRDMTYLAHGSGEDRVTNRTLRKEDVGMTDNPDPAVLETIGWRSPFGRLSTELREWLNRHLVSGN